MVDTFHGEARGYCFGKLGCRRVLALTHCSQFDGKVIRAQESAAAVAAYVSSESAKASCSTAAAARPCAA